MRNEFNERASMNNAADEAANHDPHLAARHLPGGEYVSIPQSELSFMAGDADVWGNCETGGALYGLFSHAGRAVIGLAIPSGPDASNERMHFAQNPDYLMEVNRRLQEKYGVQYVGNWHSHHNLDLDHPSGGDVEQIHRVARKGNISRMVQIVITRQEDRHPSDSATMRIDTFIYADAKEGSYRRCKLKLLSEPSLIRSALTNSDILQPTKKQSPDFRLDQVVYDVVGPSDKETHTEQEIPLLLSEQLDRLGPELQRHVRASIRDDVIVISLPLLKGNELTVAYGVELPCRIQAVYIIEPRIRKTIDITKAILLGNSGLALSAIYARAKLEMSQFTRDVLNCRDVSDNMKVTEVPR